MSNFISAIKTFAADENGVTAIEYGLIAALIGVGIVAATTGVRDQLRLLFNDIVNNLKV
jgi:pilus assembly protein Flp/PilA